MPEIRYEAMRLSAEETRLKDTYCPAGVTVLGWGGKQLIHL